MENEAATADLLTTASDSLDLYESGAEAYEHESDVEFRERLRENEEAEEHDSKYYCAVVSSPTYNQGSYANESIYFSYDEMMLIPPKIREVFEEWNYLMLEYAGTDDSEIEVDGAALRGENGPQPHLFNTAHFNLSDLSFEEITAVFDLFGTRVKIVLLVLLHIHMGMPEMCRAIAKFYRQEITSEQIYRATAFVRSGWICCINLFSPENCYTNDFEFFFPCFLMIELIESEADLQYALFYWEERDESRVNLEKTSLLAWHRIKTFREGEYELFAHLLEIIMKRNTALVNYPGCDPPYYFDITWKLTNHPESWSKIAERFGKFSRLILRMVNGVFADYKASTEIESMLFWRLTRDILKVFVQKQWFEEKHFGLDQIRRIFNVENAKALQLHMILRRFSLPYHLAKTIIDFV